MNGERIRNILNEHVLEEYRYFTTLGVIPTQDVQMFVAHILCARGPLGAKPFIECMNTALQIFLDKRWLELIEESVHSVLVSFNLIEEDAGANKVFVLTYKYENAVVFDSHSIADLYLNADRVHGGIQYNDEIRALVNSWSSET